MEKIVALSVVFDVTTDYLLKSSEIDDLSVKTEMLEKQQQIPRSFLQAFLLLLLL